MEPRPAWVDWLLQMSANMVGTLAAAGVIYLVGVVAGLIPPDRLVTILTGVGFLVVFLGFAIRLVMQD